MFLCMVYLLLAMTETCLRSPHNMKHEKMTSSSTIILHGRQPPKKLKIQKIPSQNSKLQNRNRRLDVQNEILCETMV
jgi:hypothetical protein